jgi:hypothetical protein
MQTENMIALDEFCSSHQVEISFIQSLEDYGLIDITIADRTLCIAHDDLPRLEMIVRLHNDLSINLEGIDAINNLLQRIDAMQNEIAALRNKLNSYENEK